MALGTSICFNQSGPRRIFPCDQLTRSVWARPLLACQHSRRWTNRTWYFYVISFKKINRTCHDWIELWVLNRKDWISLATAFTFLKIFKKFPNYGSLNIKFELLVKTAFLIPLGSISKQDLTQLILGSRFSTTVCKLSNFLEKPTEIIWKFNPKQDDVQFSTLLWCPVF